MIITNHCKDPYEPTSISWNVGVFFCVAHLSNEKTSMFTLKINGWNIIMEVWFRSFSPVKICRFHGHLPECRSYSGVSLCFTISGLYQDILRYKDDNSLSGSLLTDQHIQQKCNQVFFHPSLGRAKVKRFFLRGSCDENRVAVLVEAKAYFVARNYALSLRNWMAVPSNFSMSGSAKTAQAKFGEICSETSWTCRCEIGNNKDGRKLLLRGFVSKFFDVGRCPIWQRAYVSKRVETTTSDFCDPKIVAVVFGAKE